ncbi:MAG: pilus assembly protein CpaF, partial [Actinomycetota bacterium]|nr:pilus assembly protein CpaF [Actinomycetota bacterium]
IVAQVGRRVDESVPMVDARLPDGSRVNAVIAPLAIGGPFLTIRKFAKDPFQVEDLINFGSFSRTVAQFLDACVKGRLNIIVSGGTGTGKTTALNVLSSFIPHDERIVTVEDAKELQLHQDHVLALEARPPNIEGKGEVRIRDLVRNTLRMRPDRIVVGECRGGEALDMLQAMNTGHDGSITTIHSNTPRDTLSRIETMTLMAGFDLPMRAIREQMASALDCIVQLTRLRDGTRRITHVTEVQGMEGDVITLQDIFLFDYGMGVDEDGRFQGTLKATGIRPKFAERLQDYGIKLRPELFQSDGFARSAVGTR